MQNKIKKTVEVEEIESITCDRCKKEYPANESGKIHHFQFIKFSPNPNDPDSVFGEITEVEADICQTCLKELIGDFCKTIERKG